MKKRVEITNSPEETQRLAGDLIRELLLDSRLRENDTKKNLDSRSPIGVGDKFFENDTKGRGQGAERGESNAKKKRKKAIVIGLEGELGSGKTAFIQGMAKELGIKELVTSPTFVIFKKYSVGRSPFAVRCFYHFDCYRLDSVKDILDLGFREIVSRPENLAAIEWSEKIKKILPKDCLIIKFRHLGADKRKIEILCHSRESRNPVTRYKDTRYKLQTNLKSQITIIKLLGFVWNLDIVICLYPCILFLVSWSWVWIPDRVGNDTQTLSGFSRKRQQTLLSGMEMRPARNASRSDGGRRRVWCPPLSLSGGRGSISQQGNSALGIFP